MYRFPIAATIVLASILVLGGCAAKTGGEVALSAPETPAEAGIEAAATEPTTAASEKAASPAAATLSTLDGRQLEPVYFDYDAFSLSIHDYPIQTGRHPG